LPGTPAGPEDISVPETATGKIQRVVVRDVVAQRLGKPGE
jgi:acyl-coenzyme A synthetase/AMP-(fatty) acid ligase